LKKVLLTLLAGSLIASVSAAAAPSAPPASALTKEQAQELMLRQMQMMAAMFESRPSRLGFDETVNTFRERARKSGWSAPEVQDVGASMRQAGAKDAKRMNVISTCPADGNARLAKASQGKLPPLPCRYTVFEGQDGKIYLVRMNTPLLSKTLQGDAAKVMLEIASAEDEVMKGIVN